MKERLDREDSIVLAMSKTSSHATLNNYPQAQRTLHQRVQVLQKYDSGASFRSRDSSDSEEGSFSKSSRKRGSIFIV